MDPGGHRIKALLAADNPAIRSGVANTKPAGLPLLQRLLPNFFIFFFCGIAKTNIGRCRK